MALPSEIGVEASGVIKKIGSKVKSLSVGDRVAYAGLPVGSYADERIYPADKLVKLPRNYFEIAASIMTKGLTVYYLLYKTFKIKSHDTVLFHAAAGGVGQIFVSGQKVLDVKLLELLVQMKK